MILKGFMNEKGNNEGQREGRVEREEQDKEWKGVCVGWREGSEKEPSFFSCHVNAVLTFICREKVLLHCRF